MNQRNEIRNDLAGMLWGPDWWARLMAFGSLLVAAAALWVARNPDVPSVVGSDSGKSVATSGQSPGLDGTHEVDSLNPIDDSESPVVSNAANTQSLADAANTVRPASHEEPAGAPSQDALSGLAYAAANAVRQDVDPADEAAAKEEPTTTGQAAVSDVASHTASAEGKETTALRANELLDEIEDVFSGKDLSTPEELQAKTKLVEVPSDGADGDSSTSVAADSAPSLPDDSLTLDGNKFEQDGLVVVNVEPQPLKSEFAVSMTLRNTSDRMVVISRVLFRPREIIENVSTEFASRPFGVSSSSEFVLAFGAEDNLSEDPSAQGRYDRQLSVPDTYTVAAGDTVDVRLAIHDPDHVGYGLVGKLTLEYNVSESLDVENTPIAFIADAGE